MDKIHVSTSFKEFLLKTDNRVARVLKRHLVRGIVDGPLPVDRLMFSFEINYLTFRPDGTISYLPKGKEHITNEDGTWSQKGRTNGKPARVIRKLFTDKALLLFSDSDFDHFGRSFKAHFEEGNELELLPADAIPDVYTAERVCTGSLVNSCMQHKPNSYFEIYEKSDKVRILTCKTDDGRLAARALVWECQMTPEPEDEEQKLVWTDITLLDRVYVSRDHLEDSFFEYAKQRGWYRKSYQNSDSKRDLTTPDNKRIRALIRVETETEFEEYPYIDTFTYGHPGLLQNFEDYAGFTFECTDGTYQDDHEPDRTGQVYDHVEDEWYLDNGTYTFVEIEAGEYTGLKTREKNTITVEGKRYWEYSGHVVRLGVSSERILKVNAAFCEYSLYWYPKEEMVFSSLKNGYYRKELCVESEQGWILQTDAVEENGKTYHKRSAPSFLLQKRIEAEEFEEDFKSQFLRIKASAERVDEARNDRERDRETVQRRSWPMPDGGIVHRERLPGGNWVHSESPIQGLTASGAVIDDVHLSLPPMQTINIVSNPSRPSWLRERAAAAFAAAMLDSANEQQSDTGENP